MQTSPDPEIILRDTFGFDTFRSGQKEVIEAGLAVPGTTEHYILID